MPEASRAFRDTMSRNKKKSRTTAFYVPRETFSAGRVVFPPEEEHHLRQVLRLGNGAEVEVLDGCGALYRVVVEQGLQGSALVGRVLSVERIEAAKPFISVALALGRKERTRMAVEKLAELGCHRIVPLLTDNSAFRGDPDRQVEKLSLVCRSALKQSRNRFLTGIEPPMPFEDFAALARKDGFQPVFCVKNAEPSNRKSGKHKALTPSNEYFLVIGPEGGFSPGEQALIDCLAAPHLQLGSADLRFETAATAGFVLLRELLRGDLYLY